MLPNSPLGRVPRDRLPPPMQTVWDKSHELHKDTTFAEVMGNAPAIFRWYIDDFYAKLFYSGAIDVRILELVRLRLANIHGCAFCNRSDRLSAAEAGITEAEMDALPDYENGPFTEAEKAALNLADTMALTNPNGYITPELYSRLSRNFSDETLVHLGVVMAVLAGMAKFIFAYDLVEKEDYCPFTPVKGQ